MEPLINPCPLDVWLIVGKKKKRPVFNPCCVEHVNAPPIATDNVKTFSQTWHVTMDSPQTWKLRAQFLKPSER
ncbi:Uncharacterized protein TCM_019650 [Theobroma cacao]|uniref:Uncharacterized protein n=1 Tax=Theobroma cacao TaxID=3641 RepID=A0A061EPX9_THECC|nr:Uncharacterized protein TCM_019650 [Theobroma cacao]